jgi:predicted PurR-regulated permease PerM
VWACASPRIKIIGSCRVTNRSAFFWLTLGLLFFVFIFLIRGILLPFVVGMLAAYLLDPAADRLEARGFSRSVSTLLITGFFFLVLAIIFIVIPPVIVNQLSGLIAALPDYLNAFHAKYDARMAQWMGHLPTAEMESIRQAAADSSGKLVAFFAGFLSSVFQSGLVIANVLALMLITPVVTFYLLRDWDHLVAHLDTLLPRAHAKTIRQQLAKINDTLAGFLRGQLNVCLILAIYYSIGLSLAGLKFGMVIGLIAGFLVIIPYVGALFSALVGLSVAFFQFDNFVDIAIVLGVFLLGQTIEGYFLTPKLVGEKVGLHPVWIIFGMLAGAALFGFVGVLIAVPVTAVIGVLIRFATERYLQSSYYRGR